MLDFGNGNEIDVTPIDSDDTDGMLTFKVKEPSSTAFDDYTVNKEAVSTSE